VTERVKANRGVIHPSIDGLVDLIAAGGSGEELEKLRELCRSKLRTYSLEAYLKRYTVSADQVAARERWERVAAFANRSEKA
jgi:hypothetical protein